MRIVLLLLLFAPPLAVAQDALEFRDARFVDAFGRVDTTGMGPVRFMTGPEGMEAWVGRTLMEVERGEVEVVGFSFDPFANAPLVSLELAPEAAEAFARITGERVGRPLAIVLGDRLLSAPRINGLIEGGRISIEGVTQEEAFDLIESIRAAVGGRSPREGVRERFDLSTPEVAAESIKEALGVADWQLVARALHPRAIGALREDMGVTTVRLVGDRAEGLVEPLDGVSVRISPVLGPLPPGTAFSDLSNEDVIALSLALVAEVGGGQGWLPVHIGEIVAVSVVGTRAYVIRDEKWFGEEAGLANAAVFVFEHVEESGEWRMLLPLQ
jgi:hypothetical protein